jgi:Tfp pilus assembly protein PilF
MKTRGAWLCCIAILAASACSKNSQAAKKAFMDSGDHYVAQKNYAEAGIQFRNAVAIDGSDGTARLKLAEVYALMGDRINALHEYVRAADLMPNNVVAQLRAGKGLLEAGQIAEAKQRALDVLQKEPKNVEAMILLGYALAGLKDLDGAIKEVEQAIEAEPRRVLSYTNLGLLEYAKNGRPAAESALKRATEIEPKSVDAHLSLANFYWAGQQNDQADREFKIALDLDPNSATGNRAYAQFLLANGKAAQGEQYLKRNVAVSPDLDGKVILADYYLAVGRPKDAVAVLEPLSHTKDGFVVAKLRLAALDFAANRRKDAYDGLDAIFKREPKNDDALVEKARFLLLEGKYADALAPANAAVESNPQSAPAHYTRGQALEGSGSIDDAIKAFQDVLKLRPSAVAAQVELGRLFLLRGDPAAATELLIEAVKSGPQTVQVHYLLAKALIGISDLGHAEREVTIVTNSTPNNAATQVLAGDYYVARRDAGRARAAYARAFELNPKSVDALTGLVRIDLVEGKRDAVRARLDSRLAAVDAKKDPSLLLLAGKTFLVLEDQQRAERMLRDCLEVDPSNMDAYSSLAGLLKTEGRLDDAKKEYEEVARRLPKTAVVADTMIGIILALQDKHDEAVKHFEKALAVDPRAAVAANNLAWEYAERGANLDVALSLAQTAKARLPNNSEATDTLGWIYYKKDMAALAISTLQQGTEQEPSNATLHYHLGLAYLKSGDRTNARKSLQQALKLAPQSAFAEDARKTLGTIKG